MPQDIPPQTIPYEASDVLAFTPASLQEFEGAPSFSLRAATTREKRFHRRLYVEEGLGRHDDAAIRREILTGLQKLWTEEVFTEHKPIIETYWSAIDDFALQRKDDPELNWTYDAELEQGVKDLIGRVVESYPPLRRILADNSEFEQMSLPLVVAVIVKSWTGLTSPRLLDRGFITVNCAEKLKDALEKYEKEQGVPESGQGMAWTELATACLARLYLDEEEAKNFVSPSPASTPQPLSNETPISEPAGKSRVSARSPKKTPVTA